MLESMPGNPSPLERISRNIICARCKRDAAEAFAAHPSRAIQFSYCEHHGFGVLLQGAGGKVSRADHNKDAVYSLPGGALYVAVDREYQRRTRALINEAYNRRVRNRHKRRHTPPRPDDGSAG